MNLKSDLGFHSGFLVLGETLDHVSMRHGHVSPPGFLSSPGLILVQFQYLYTCIYKLEAWPCKTPKISRLSEVDFSAVSILTYIATHN